MQNRPLALVAALGLGAALAAQPTRGEPAPAFKIRAAVQGEVTEPADFEGHAVLLDLFATW